MSKLINKSSSADDIKRIIRSVDASLTDNDITAIANQILSIKDSLAGIGNKKAYISRCIETYKHNANIPPQNKNTQPNNKFINFTQRSYDFAELEKEILDN